MACQRPLRSWVIRVVAAVVAVETTVEIQVVKVHVVETVRAPKSRYSDAMGSVSDMDSG